MLCARGVADDHRVTSSAPTPLAAMSRAQAANNAEIGNYLSGSYSERRPQSVNLEEAISAAALRSSFSGMLIQNYFYYSDLLIRDYQAWMLMERCSFRCASGMAVDSCIPLPWHRLVCVRTYLPPATPIRPFSVQFWWSWNFFPSPS
jgi:hypothetical protein